MKDNTQLQAGDIVKHVLWPSYGLGRVLAPASAGLYPLEFENWTGSLHTAGGLGREGYCWFSERHNLVFVSRPDAPTKRPRTFDLNSQTGRILAHLLAGNSITPLQAFGVFGTFRLAARIKELRDAGHKIKTTIKRDPNGRPYAEYSLRNSGRF